jgi:hypothetical protein
MRLKKEFVIIECVMYKVQSENEYIDDHRAYNATWRSQSPPLHWMKFTLVLLVL